MISRTPYAPMRPKTRIPPLDRYSGPLPKGWHWQVKLDDERGIVQVHSDGSVELFNRHWDPLASNKAAVFRDAAATLPARFPGETIFDVALLGFRGVFVRGGIVLLDIPSDLSWAARRIRMLASGEIHVWDPLVPVACDPPSPLASRLALAAPVDLVSVLPDIRCDSDAAVREFFLRTKDAPGIEGLIGRDPAAPHQSGDSDRMVKIRWK